MPAPWLTGNSCLPFLACSLPTRPLAYVLHEKDKLAEQEQVQINHLLSDFTQHGTGGGTTQQVLAELRINSETDPDCEAVTRRPVQ